MKEIWKNIPGYEGFYQVSNLGRVKSLKRYHGKSKKLLNKIIILNPGVTTKGYSQLRLYKNSIAKSFLIQRLVAKSFIPNLKNKPQVNHIDGVKSNNKVNNLEWCTNSENQIHAVKNNLVTHHKGEYCYKSQLTNKQAAKIRELSKTMLRKELQTKYNVSKTVIGNLLRNKTYKNIGV